ncbi:MAG: porin, partial [Planctomycetales bacterium]
QGRFRTFAEGRSENRWLDTGRIAGADAYQILGVESVFNMGPLQITGEFMKAWLQRDAASGRNVDFQGGYLYVSYFLTGEHIPWNRELGILGRVEPIESFIRVSKCKCERGVERGRGAWQVAARLSHADLNDDDVFGGVGRSATLALNWHWNSHSQLQFNYIIGRINDRVTVLNGGAAVVSGEYQIAGTRFVIDF